MAYEIIYKYYKEIKRGEYNKEEVFDGNLPVGSPYEKISLDILASKVMSLLAKRSIHVFDMEVFEIVKKKIDFEEVDDGVKIKDKKYLFDEMPVSTSAVAATKPPEDLTAVLSKLLTNPEFLASLQQKGLPTNIAQPTKEKVDNVPLGPRKSPIRHEIYQPMNGVAVSARFTVGKKYPIYMEKISKNQTIDPKSPMAAPFYETMDDSGSLVMTNSLLFVPDVKIDEGKAQKNAPEEKKEVDLWNGTNGVEGGAVPALRRR